jgi:hypothetical protein
VLPAATAAAAAPAKTRDVLYVGHNWDGTADVVDPNTFQVLARINIIPDIDERMAEIQSDPERSAYLLVIRELVGEGPTSTSTTCSPPTTVAICARYDGAGRDRGARAGLPEQGRSPRNRGPAGVARPRITQRW